MKNARSWNKSFTKCVEAAYSLCVPSNTDMVGGIQTVAEYIDAHDVKVELRTSKKGIGLIKVFYPTGKVAEYELANIDRTIAYEV